MKILSLGWGVQSFTLAAMSALGELPPITAAIHADTGWEHQATYEFAHQFTPWLEKRGVRVVTVGDPVQTAKITTGFTDMPAFTLADDGSRGQLRRQCTGRLKIQPIRRWLSQELARRGLKKTPGIIEQWLGVTVDEIERAKDSDVQYISHHYPLLDKQMTRVDCQLWLQNRDLPIPPKSSCVF